MSVLTAEQLTDRITEYLGNGGLWNTESMEHVKVVQLLSDCRKELDDLTQRLAASEERFENCMKRHDEAALERYRTVQRMVRAELELIELRQQSLEDRKAEREALETIKSRPHDIGCTTLAPVPGKCSCAVLIAEAALGKAKLLRWKP